MVGSMFSVVGHYNQPVGGFVCIALAFQFALPFEYYTRFSLITLLGRFKVFPTKVNFRERTWDTICFQIEQIEQFLL